MFFNHIYSTIFTVILLVEVITAKTAPEFKLTVDTETFKEIRIPMHIWKRIVTKDYYPSGKITVKLGQPIYAIKQTEVLAPNINGTVLHEVVLNVVVPEEEEDEKPLLEEQIVVEPEVPGTSNVNEQVSEVAADVTQTVSDSEVLTDPPPSAVLVQTQKYPCVCEKGICECCATVFRQKGCVDVKFLPEDFAFELKMSMNGDLLARRILPMSDPPPFCFNPRRAPFLELCAQLNNISIRKQNIHACVDLDASIGGFDLFSWNYDCVKFGRQGLISGIRRPSGGESDVFDFFGGGGAILDGIFGGGDDDDSDDY